MNAAPTAPTSTDIVSPLVVPRHAVQQRFRTPKANIPQTTFERTRILHAVRNYVAEFNPVPPMPMADLKVHADRLLDQLGCDRIYRAWRYLEDRKAHVSLPAWYCQA